MSGSGIGKRAETFERRFRSQSAEQTRAFGRALGKALKSGCILAIHGDLGSGKTVFVQGLAAGLGVPDADLIHSPTFALLQEHRGRLSLCHADLYRLDPNEVAGLGLEEYWQARAGEPWVVAIEWAERAQGFLARAAEPEKVLNMHFEIRSSTERDIFVVGLASWKKALQSLAF